MDTKNFSKNLIGNDYVVGDIHGCFTKLECELYTLGFDESKDRLFSVGDLVDRGVESEKSLDWLDKPWFHAVRGNHEQMIIDASFYGDNSNEAAMAYINGGQWWFSQFKEDRQKYVEAFSYLPYVISIETEDLPILIIHAEPYTLDYAETSVLTERQKQICIWSRTKIQRDDATPVLGVSHVYCGHTPIDEPKTYGNVTYIDTGAVFKGGKLTILKI